MPITAKGDFAPVYPMTVFADLKDKPFYMPHPGDENWLVVFTDDDSMLSFYQAAKTALGNTKFVFYEAAHALNFITNPPDGKEIDSFLLNPTKYMMPCDGILFPIANVFSALRK